MSDHLSAKQLNGYIHQTLTDAAREAIDAHLAGCQLCRGQLAEHTALQQRLRYELLGELNSVHAPLSLTFASTIDRRRRTVSSIGLWPRFGRVAAGLIALMVVALVAVSAIGTLRQTTTNPWPAPTSSIVPSGGRMGGWYVYYGGDAHDYEVGLDHEVTHNGQASGYISSTVNNPTESGNLMQVMRADHYQGQRLRLSAYVKTDQVAGRAGLWMRIDGSQGTPLSIDNMVNRPIRGTTDWQRYDIVLDVPTNSNDVAFGVLLMGSGRVWIDDVQFDVVGLDVATTAVTEEMIAAETPPTPVAEPTRASTPSPVDLAALSQPTNLSFETGTNGWAITGDTQDYLSGIDSTVTFDGQNSGFLAWDISRPIGQAQLVQAINAKPYHSQRVRISALVKSDSMSQWKARFFAVAYVASGEKLLSDSRLMRGSTWQKDEIVFDVPDTATRIEYGIALEGQGRAWLDNVQVEVVGKDVSTTTYMGMPDLQPLQLQGSDLDGDLSNLSIYGNQPQKYEMGFDTTVAHTGRSSAYIKSTTSVAAPDFGTLGNKMDMDYRGKRIRLSAYIKTSDVKAWAGLWMRVDGPSGRIPRFDNMEDRPIQGTSDWQKYEVVLDVPDNSVDVFYGVLLAGEGEVWFDDVQIEVVGTDVPETDLYHPEPLNLGFENENQSKTISLPTATPTPIPPSKPLAHFGDVVTLLDAKLPEVSLAPGATLKLTLHWAISPTSPALMSFAHVPDLQGNSIVAQSDQPLPPTATSAQTLTLYLPAELPPGKYQIVVGVYDATTNERLTADAGSTEIQLGTFEIAAASAADFLPWTAGVTHCVTGDATSHGPSVHELDFDLDNEPILAVQAGTVITAGFDGPEGYAIQIRHADGTIGFYSHLSRIDVMNGGAIKRGQTIGLSGSTGLSTGPHLAFKVLLDSATMPLLFSEADHELRTGECIASQNQPLP